MNMAAVNIELTLDDMQDMLADLDEPWLHEALELTAPTPTPKSCKSGKATASQPVVGTARAVVLGVAPGGPPVVGTVLGYSPQKEEQTGRGLKRRASAPAELQPDSTRKALRWSDAAQCSAEEELKPFKPSLAQQQSDEKLCSIEIATGVPVEVVEEETVPPRSVENAKDLSGTIDMRAVYDEVKGMINMSFEEFMELYYSGF